MCDDFPHLEAGTFRRDTLRANEAGHPGTKVPLSFYIYHSSRLES
jgi:hypothetical protein